MVVADQLYTALKEETVSDSIGDILVTVSPHWSRMPHQL